MGLDVEEGKVEVHDAPKRKSRCFAGCSRLLNTVTAVCALLCIVACGLAIAVDPEDKVGTAPLRGDNTPAVCNCLHCQHGHVPLDFFAAGNPALVKQKADAVVPGCSVFTLLYNKP